MNCLTSDLSDNLLIILSTEIDVVEYSTHRFGLAMCMTDIAGSVISFTLLYKQVLQELIESVLVS
jgi:hypothetical protein